jgi:hypothetical protein
MRIDKGTNARRTDEDAFLYEKMLCLHACLIGKPLCSIFLPSKVRIRTCIMLSSGGHVFGNSA